jgi:hypothetical protein
MEKIMKDSQTTMAEDACPFGKEQFEALLAADKKFVVKELAKKIADSPDLKEIWVNSQVEGEKPLIEWNDEKLMKVARDYYGWE